MPDSILNRQQAANVVDQPRRPCPQCGKPADRQNFPFCSPRCRSIDLNRWLSGHYILPGQAFDDNET